MRVAIDATALGSGRGGDETYIRGLIEGLAQATAGTAPSFPVILRPGAEPPATIRGHAQFPVRSLRWGPALLRYGVTLPRLLARESPPLDLVHTFVHAPLFPPVPLAHDVPDLSFVHHPEFFPASTRLRLKLLVPIHIRQARVVLTLSEFSRRDLMATFGLSPGRVFVVPAAVTVASTSAVERSSAVDPCLARLGVQRPYFLYVGNLHPRKNVPRLIEAFARARRATPEMDGYRLVVAGARWFGGSGEEVAARRAPPGSVVFIGQVSDADRDHLMRAAKALAYPSLFEGFGLPPLEAMALGTPVLASRTSAMPEVLGDAALLVDPLDVDAIAQGLVRLATDDPLCAELRRRGPNRAAHYSPRATGEAALCAFQEAVAG